jgi:hypothetical protein
MALLCSSSARNPLIYIKSPKIGDSGGLVFRIARANRGAIGISWESPREVQRRYPSPDLSRTAGTSAAPRQTIVDAKKAEAAAAALSKRESAR